MNSKSIVTLSFLVVISLQFSALDGPAMSKDQERPTQRTCCPIVELRQYTLRPGQRDTLIELFDREFVTSQEATGMTIIGQFRDLDNPDRFVWLRGFADMPSRARSLTDFYSGPVWKAHSKAANATMIDSDHVLLLHPARSESGFAPITTRAKAASKGLVVATIYYFAAPVTDEFVGFFERGLKPVLEDNGASILAYFVTDPSPNTFPGLPVREGENVFVWLSRFRDHSAYEAHEVALARLPRWQSELSLELKRWLKGKPEVLKLSPTEGSKLVGY